MAPKIFNFKELRRRSRASFRTEESSSEGSQGTPTSGSLTPPSISPQSDPALDLLLKETLAPVRPSLQTVANGASKDSTGSGSSGGSNRNSVSGMTGLGSPAVNGKSALPVSHYAPRISNVTENAWVSS
jgi:hypothetical protein